MSALPSSHHPFCPASWNPNVCPFLHWWLGSRLGEQSPLELAASLRTQEKESEVEPGAETQPNAQDACEGAAALSRGGLFSVASCGLLFFWVLVIADHTTKSLELVALGKPLRCQKRKSLTQLISLLRGAVWGTCFSTSHLRIRSDSSFQGATKTRSWSDQGELPRRRRWSAYRVGRTDTRDHETWFPTEKKWSEGRWGQEFRA